MAVEMASQFSEDGEYFANISTDGKLKIWNTVSSTFEQEFTPDFHLTTPCTCLQFMQSDSIYQGASPRKKKRKESETNLSPKVVLGTTSGLLLVYSISNASLEYTVDSETSQPVNCLSSVDSNTVYSGAEQDVFVWSLQKRKLIIKWKGGAEKITSILAIPNSAQLLTASKNIKLWDINTKEVLRTFTGHSSDVTFLQHINPRTNGDSYFISGSKGDRLLSCWNLDDSNSNRNAVANFLMEDIVQNVSVNIASDSSTNLVATVRSGVAHIYQHTLNGKCSKPFKPKTTIQVVSDTEKSDELVTPIRIVGAVYKDDKTLCIGHGTDLLLTFENVVISPYKKVQCLIRKDPRRTVSKEEQTSKIRTPIVNDDVHYLTNQTSIATTTKRKNKGQLEVPIEQRLENLALNKLDNSKVPRVDDVAQLLVQGLHSKDRNMLRTVLSKQEDSVIRKSVKRLPIPCLAPLIKELVSFIQGKTLSSQIGFQWIKQVLEIHAGILISMPELSEVLGPAIGSIESRLSLLTPLNRLRGRLEIILSEISTSPTQDTSDENNPLLLFNDKDSSDSEEDHLQIDSESGNEFEWEEESSTNEAEQKSNDSESDVENMSS